MSKIYKTFKFEVKERHADGGSITVSTSVVDRDKDRVFPSGAMIDNYLKNPVVQFAHNYRDPWATIGRSDSLTIGGDGIDSDFTLRPAANEQDPQNIIRLLWEKDFIRAASIGFNPDQEHTTENEFGGFDFKQWELLEWSLVAIPANQASLARMVKALGDSPEGKRRTVMPCATCGNETEVSHTLALYTLVGKQPVFCEHCAGVVNDLFDKSYIIKKPEPETPEPEEETEESLSTEQNDSDTPTAEADTDTQPDDVEATHPNDTPSPDNDDDDELEPEDEERLAEVLGELVETVAELIS